MNLLKQLETEQVAKLTAGKEIPEFQPGDTVVVNVKIIEGERSRVQAYEGVCIGRAGAGLNENFTVRKISYGEGVERVFPLYSPMIELDQSRAQRQGAPRQALLPARPARQVRAHYRTRGPRRGRGSRRQQESGGVTRRPHRVSCPAQAGHPVTGSAAEWFQTAVITGSSAFADDDRLAYSSSTVLKSAGSTISKTSQSSE